MQRRKFLPFLAFILIMITSLATSAQNDTSAKRVFYTHGEKLPQFPGGKKKFVRYLRDNIVYPKLDAKGMDLAGYINGCFIITNEGRIDNISFHKSFSEKCNASLAEVMGRSPLWKPGTVNGNTVSMHYLFSLQMLARYKGKGYLRFFQFRTGYYASNESHTLALPDSSILFKPKIPHEDFKNRYTFYLYQLAWSFGNYEDIKNLNTQSMVRITGLPNMEVFRNIKIGRESYFYAGLSFVNMGFSTSDTIVTTYRYLALGIPAGFKFFIKNEIALLQIGGGMDFPFHYKCKIYYTAGKVKNEEYFSDQIPFVQPYLLIALQFPGLEPSVFAGWQIRFKTYLQEFFNTNYEKQENGQITKPYQNVSIRPMEIALTLGY